ncbi:uridine kinase [Candidatus Rickettsiella viridis]|uniref:Uridine kinase n=1 Tax=Candidatus Rickettsiella viridis TaxID=676208 RepID=A0A2Z5V3B9_9COXI|nr:uridine kinase [Candidatus Rickettsiella viridis]BBB14952.1 uridine kinase [Candidatus Rickettsiella viridis]
MTQRCIIIGIAGASASGKSLLAHTIVKELGSEQVAVIAEDSYYKNNSALTPEERAQVNYDHPDAFDHALLINHLKQLQAGKSVEIPIYNHTLHIREQQTRCVGPHSIIVLEGILLFAELALRERMDIRIYMDTPLDICLIRRIKRDVIERGREMESVLAQYQATVRPMYSQFIEPSKHYADIIIPRGGENRIAIDMIKAKIRELLIDFSEKN